MAADDSLSDPDSDLIRAAQAAASWAHARRATWTDAPVGAAAAASASPNPEASIDLGPVTAPPPIAVFPAPGRSDRSVASRIAESARAFGPPAGPRLARAAVAVALGMAALVGVPYVWKALPSFSSRKPAVVGPTQANTPAVARKPAGGLRVTTTPAGAQVLVDGKSRGVTPLTLTDLSPGLHDVALQSDAGTVHKNVTIAANETADLAESIFSGWLAVFAPFEVVISEDERELRLDDRNQVMLPPGIHQLRLANKALAYDAVWSVEVKPGEKTNLQVRPEPSTLTVTASEAAEVWLDGARVGETPLTAAPVPLGSHELVVKRVTGGERRFTVTIGVNPFTLNVDFR